MDQWVAHMLTVYNLITRMLIMDIMKYIVVAEDLYQYNYILILLKYLLVILFVNIIIFIMDFIQLDLIVQ